MIKQQNKIKPVNNDGIEIDKTESDFKLLNTKILKQQQLIYDMSHDNFLKSSGSITLSY